MPLDDHESTGKARQVGPSARRPAADHNANKPSRKGVALMKQTKFLAIGGAAASLAACAVTVAAPASAAPASGTTVSVRVEGISRTLLAPKTIKTHGGWVTKGGTPVGQCPATSAAGALDVATKGKWGGKFSSGLGVEVLSILGEKHSFTSNYFWGIWVNNRFAQFGACALKLRKGDQLLLGAISDAALDIALVLRAPSHVPVGHAFTVKVVSLPVSGAAKPVAGARVGGVLTNGRGNATLTAKSKGTLVLRAIKKPYVRSASMRVAVS
jgi:hypothetical protein